MTQKEVEEITSILINSFVTDSFVWNGMFKVDKRFATEYQSWLDHFEERVAAGTATHLADVGGDNIVEFLTIEEINKGF